MALRQDNAKAVLPCYWEVLGSGKLGDKSRSGAHNQSGLISSHENS